MVDTNKFKRSVKDWIKENPNGTMDDLVDFCEELISPTQLNSYGWLIEQTAGWYDHVLNTRRASSLFNALESEDMA
jgi:hypothetical protein